MDATGTRARWIGIGALCAAAALSGCGGGSSQNGGAIAFSDGPSVAVTKGSYREIVLSLQGGNAVVSKTVSLASLDTAIADVVPASCTLSTSSVESNRCTLKLMGKSSGTVQLAAKADGYQDAALTAQVGELPVYGNLVVANGTAAGSAGPVSIGFDAAGSAPYQKKLSARLKGSSGITAGDDAIINYSSAVPGVTFTPAQCQVTTASPKCDTVVSLPAAVATAITVQVVGAVTTQVTGYKSVAVSAVPDTTPSHGVITLSTQAGNNVPNGMKAPLFINWENPQVVDKVTIALSIAPVGTATATGVSFYSYPAGDNRNIQTAKTETCVLSYTGVQATNVTSCGLGLVGTAASGSYTVSATVTSASKHAFVIEPLTLGAVAPEPTRRSVTFTNNSSETVYVGITGGASSAYLDASTPAVAPGATAANQKPGAGSLCGASNLQAACPIGTSCVQGGAAPSTKVADTPFYCYYDQTAPSNGYAIAAGGGTTTLAISGSSLSPSGIIWSGNVYGRTGCDPTTGVCENASCQGAGGGLACGAGTGPSPGTNTLAELTFQAYPSVDYYDVSIINGANLAIQFGPTNVAVAPANAYSCGTAGSMKGSYTPGSDSLASLPAATWTMSPTTAESFPTGLPSPPGEAASYYRVVIPSATPAQQCTDSTTCTAGTDRTCGYAKSDLGKGPLATFDKRYCGKPVAWMSADSIWGFNSTHSNVAPFAFNTSWPAGSQTVSAGDLQLCINNTYSAYSANGTASSMPAFPVQPVALACGGVMWGSTESPGPQQNPPTNLGQRMTVPSLPVQTANAHWLDYVLPTIKWLKAACPTCYTYPFDDITSTFTCADSSRNPSTSYGVTFSDLR